MRWLVILSLMIWSGVTWAARAPSDDPCPSQVHRSAFNNLVQFASIIVPEDGMPDPRLTYEMYQQRYRTPQGEQLTIDEVYDKFSANGRMFCQMPDGTWRSSSSNVVHKANVVLLSAHAFYDEKCNPKVGSEDFTGCRFQTNPNPPAKPQTFRVKSVNPGTKCPYKNKDGSPAKDKDDWAVVTLEKPVTGVHPFRLSRNCRVGLGWTGMSIAATANNFRDGKTAAITPWCSGKNYDSVASNESFRTDCSSAGGNSGGGMLCDDAGKNAPAIGGILISETATEVNPDYKTYDRATNYSTAIPINEEIESAIRAAGN